MNRVILIGRLTRDPERKITNGNVLANFTIGIDKYNPNNPKAANYPDCVCWNKTAENVCKYCSQGSLVAIEGEVQTNSYEKDGQRKKTTNILVNKIEFIDTKGKKQSETNKPSRQEINEMFDVEVDSFDIKEDDLAF